MSYLARVYVTLKPAVNDPQGLTVKGGLQTLGFSAVSEVRVGKFLEVTLQVADRATAQEQVEQMCRQLLANPVIESFRFDLEDAPAKA